MYLKNFLILFVLALPGMAQAFVPQAGTWIINSELDGKPGRGLAIDVQKDTLLMQMYAYEHTGAPTFYLATGEISSGKMSTNLMQYSGGRYLGGPAMSGRESANAGRIEFRFTGNATGFIKLPGEEEKEISRFNFAYPFEAPSLIGVWSFTTVDKLGKISSEAYKLDEMLPADEDGNGMVISMAGAFACEHYVSGVFANTVVCVKLNTLGKLERGYQFKYTANEGEGIRLSSLALNTGDVFVRRIAVDLATRNNVGVKSFNSGIDDYLSFRAAIKELLFKGIVD